MSDREMKADTTKDILSAAEIEVLQARCGEHGLPVREARRVLASHTALAAQAAALAAPGPSDGGRKLYLDLMWTTDINDVSARQESVALQMFARGLAAGRTEGEAEMASMRARLADMCKEYEKLAEKLAKAERSEAEMEKSLNATVRAHHESVEQKAAQLAEAHLAGARAERRLCIADIEGERLAAPDQGYVARVVARIRARVEGKESHATKTERPAPVPNDGPAIWPLLIAEVTEGHYGGDTPAKRRLLDDMRARDAVGRERYGVPLQPHNGRPALEDAMDEALDGCAYLRQAQEEGLLPSENGLVDQAVALALGVRRRLDALAEQADEKGDRS